MVEKKIHEKIRGNTEDQIKTDIAKLKEELKDLRNNKAASGNTAKVAKIKVVRKGIARNLSILNEKARTRVAGNLHIGSSKRPQQLRQKLTRAFRRRLTQHQRDRKLTKVQKRLSNFPVRKYGLRA